MICWCVYSLLHPKRVPFSDIRLPPAQQEPLPLLFKEGEEIEVIDFSFIHNIFNF